MNDEEETSDLVAALPGDCSANTAGAADIADNSRSTDEDKQKFLSNFSIDAIWEELARIKNHKQKVDNNYQRVMMQLKSPDPTSNN